MVGAARASERPGHSAYQQVQRLSEACRHERTAPRRRGGGRLLRSRHVRCNRIEKDLLRRCAEPVGSYDTAIAYPYVGVSR